MACKIGVVSISHDLDKHQDSFAAPQINLPQPTDDKDQKETNVPDRGTWSKSIQSILFLISMSVGLGNVWRFPNIAYNNGGGAFLIPYLLLLIIIGRPLYYLELILGQFSSQGPVKVWRVVPAFKGIGYAQMISVSLILIFYNYLMALCIFYIFASMQSCLPWTECHSDNTSYIQNSSDVNILSPSESFWVNQVLEENASPDTITMSWKLALCLLLTWIVVFMCVVKGTASLGKISYFTAIFPYAILISLLVIACLEEGALEGIKFFFKPDLQKLTDITVWYKATEQSFFSLNVGYGSIIMVASYNKFRNNVYRDAIIISVVDTLTNLLAGSVIFAVLGTLSYRYSKDISEVVNHEGLGLAFIVYPEALAAIKYVPQLWSILFFFMLFILGMGSSMAVLETVLTIIKDKFPKLHKKSWLLALAFCSLFFFIGLSLTTNKGQLVLIILNNYGVGIAAFFYATLEIVGIMWIYGLKNISKDIEFMLNKPPGIFWKFTWAFAAPVALIVILVYGSIKDTSTTDSSIPYWAVIVGWVLAGAALIQIPIWFIVAVYKDDHKGLIKKFLNSFKPTEKWGPADPEIYNDWKIMKIKDMPENLKSNKPSISGYENQTFKEDVF